MQTILRGRRASKAVPSLILTQAMSGIVGAFGRGEGSRDIVEGIEKLRVVEVINVEIMHYLSILITVYRENC